MKRTFWDIFKREFEVRLTVSARDTAAAENEQWNGIAMLSAGEGAVLHSGNAADAEETFALICELRPKVLRVFADDRDAEQWLEFCRKEEICPHVVFSNDAAPEFIRETIEKCIALFEQTELWSPKRFYEILPDMNNAPFADDAGLADLAASVRKQAELVRSLDPESSVIAGGLAPMGEYRGKAEIWNKLLLEHCAGVIDMIGATLAPSLLSGRCWNEDSDGIEAACMLADEIPAALQRLERQIRESDPDSKVRIAVTGWHLPADGVSQKAQDCVYYTAAYQAIRMSCAFVALNEFGPLFRTEGLIQQEEEIFGSVYYHDMLLTISDQPVCLKIGRAEYEKPCPVYHWEGVPGVFDPADIKLLDAFASRSRDGKRLFLLLTNRSPFIRAVPRIKFYDLPDMHPVSAFILRSKKRSDENTAEEPLNVRCKEVNLRNYRKMDHVTLEIPPCSSVCMLLE